MFINTVFVYFLLLFRTPLLFRRLYRLPWYHGLLQDWLDDVPFYADAQVLELGCAAGDLSQDLARRYRQVSAVDMSARMLAWARGDRRGQTSGPDFIQADAAQLPFADQSFDGVLGASLLNVVGDPRAVLQEMLRVTRVGGGMSVLLPGASLGGASLQQWIQAQSLSGFCAAALRVWAKRARRLDVSTVRALVQASGWCDLHERYYLNGMVFSISARRGASVI